VAEHKKNSMGPEINDCVGGKKKKKQLLSFSRG